MQVWAVLFPLTPVCQNGSSYPLCGCTGVGKGWSDGKVTFCSIGLQPRPASPPPPCLFLGGPKALNPALRELDMLASSPGGRVFPHLAATAGTCSPRSALL